MRLDRLRALAALVLAGLLAASFIWWRDRSQDAESTTELESRGRPGSLEIRRGSESLMELEVTWVDSPEGREMGLSNLDHLPDGKGMVFLFDFPAPRSFWMKDTRIPLDIAFWNESGQVVATHRMSPCTSEPCRRYESTADVVGVVEMNGGSLARAGVRRGDLVVFERR